MVLRIEIAERDRQHAVALDETIAEQGRAKLVTLFPSAERQRRDIDLLAHGADMDFGRSLLPPGQEGRAPDDDRQADIAPRQLLRKMQRPEGPMRTDDDRQTVDQMGHGGVHHHPVAVDGQRDHHRFGMVDGFLAIPGNADRHRCLDIARGLQQFPGRQSPGAASRRRPQHRLMAGLCQIRGHAIRDCPGSKNADPHDSLPCNAFERMKPLCRRHSR